MQSRKYDGAEKLELSDEEALESLDWDMSLRQFLLRLNGGSSGSSCIGAAKIQVALTITLKQLSALGGSTLAV